jgi:hypothetical protein
MATKTAAHKHADKPAKQQTVHRPLALTTPRLRGEDVEALQGSIVKGFDHFKIERSVTKDGELGTHTFDAAHDLATCLGVVGKAQGKLDHRHVISEGVQELIRGRPLTDEERTAQKQRDDYRAQMRKRYAIDGGEKAIRDSAFLLGPPPYHEEPDGSNWGDGCQKLIEFTGYDEAVYWCGCTAAFIAVKIGGARIPDRIRLGYAPFITADALAHTNGLAAVSVHSARPGDIGSLWDGEHVVTVRAAVKPGDTMVKTREGNTSPNTSGSQNNGGVVADKERPITDFDSGIVARPDWP